MQGIAVHEVWNQQVRQAVRDDPEKTFVDVEGGMLVLMHSVRKNPNICKKDCQICHDKLEGTALGDPACVQECQHWFHKGCIVRWLKQKASCPICRKPVKELLVADKDALVFNASNYESNPRFLERCETPTRAARDPVEYQTPNDDELTRKLREAKERHKNLLGLKKSR